ncbi:MAG: hypothetical protein LBC03_00020 [Nitrososphaerota archaeon]|nr:hypothetical protein [Nitrososphaerota archaeon]
MTKRSAPMVTRFLFILAIIICLASVFATIILDVPDWVAIVIPILGIIIIGIGAFLNARYFKAQRITS